MPSQINPRSGPFPIYPSASPPTRDVGMFTIVVTGVDLKTAALTNIFTVPIGRTFVAVNGMVQVTAVTSGGAGINSVLIREGGGNRTMISQSTSNSATPVANQTVYALVNASATVLSNCAAGASVVASVSTGHAGSTTVTGSIFITGYYVA